MPFSDFVLIKLIKMNIRDQISRIIYPIYITNHEAERILATRWIRHPSNLETHRGYKDRPRIDELCPESVGEESIPEEQEEVEALARHWENKCGLPGITTPRCTRCQMGNGGRSLDKKEKPRSNPFATNK